MRGGTDPLSARAGRRSSLASCAADLKQAICMPASARRQGLLETTSVAADQSHFPSRDNWRRGRRHNRLGSPVGEDGL